MDFSLGIDLIKNEKPRNKIHLSCVSWGQDTTHLRGAYAEAENVGSVEAKRNALSKKCGLLPLLVWDPIFLPFYNPK